MKNQYGHIFRAPASARRGSISSCDISYHDRVYICEFLSPRCVGTDSRSRRILCVFGFQYEPDLLISPVTGFLCAPSPKFCFTCYIKFVPANPDKSKQVKLLHLAVVIFYHYFDWRLRNCIHSFPLDRAAPQFGCCAIRRGKSQDRSLLRLFCCSSSLLVSWIEGVDFQEVHLNKIKNIHRKARTTTTAYYNVNSHLFFFLSGTETYWNTACCDSHRSHAFRLGGWHE